MTPEEDFYERSYRGFANQKSRRFTVKKNYIGALGERSRDIQGAPIKVSFTCTISFLPISDLILF